jgi:hypothetical protein
MRPTDISGKLRKARFALSGPEVIRIGRPVYL